MEHIVQGIIATKILVLVQGPHLRLPCEAAVPVVLDGVVRPAWEQLGQGRPLVAEGIMSTHNNSIFKGCELPSVELRIQLVTPAQSAALTAPSFDVLGDHCPAARAMLGYDLPQKVVLLVVPCFLLPVTR